MNLKLLLGRVTIGVFLTLVLFIVLFEAGEPLRSKKLAGQTMTSPPPSGGTTYGGTTYGGTTGTTSTTGGDTSTSLGSSSSEDATTGGTYGGTTGGTTDGGTTGGTYGGTTGGTYGGTTGGTTDGGTTGGTSASSVQSSVTSSVASSVQSSVTSSVASSVSSAASSVASSVLSSSVRSSLRSVISSSRSSSRTSGPVSPPPMIIGFSQGFVSASSQPSSVDPYDSTEPVDPLCGDERLDPGEECDDGNNGPYDGCSPRCLREFCGDGFVQAEMGEECDNGSICSHNELLFCRQDLDCRSCLPVPGVGVTRCGGDSYAKLCRTDSDCMLVNFVCSFNTKRDPTCTDSCRFFRSSSSSSVQSSLASVVVYEPVCGNGILDAAEECDDGDANADDLSNACRTNCVLPFCGDSVWDDLFGEACDQGEFNTDGERDRCRTNCMLPSCGDDILDSGEQCDDGNREDFDGCSSECRVPGIWCGNGVIESGEQCDDGNIVFGDGCSPVCTVESDVTILVQETCGDGVMDTGEQCDDENTRSGDGCSSLCREEILVIELSKCGNGVVETGEQCDDGNASDIDGCDRLCRGSQFRYAASVIPARAPVGDTGPVVIAIMASGAAAGYAWMRRKWRKV